MPAVFSLSYGERVCLGRVAAWANARESSRGRLRAEDVLMVVEAVKKAEESYFPTSTAAEVKTIVGDVSITRDESRLLKEMVNCYHEDCAYPSIPDMEESIGWEATRVRNAFNKLMGRGIIKSDQKTHYPYIIVPQTQEPTFPAPTSPVVPQPQPTPTEVRIPAHTLMRAASSIGAFPQSRGTVGISRYAVPTGDHISIQDSDRRERVCIAGATIYQGDAVFLPDALSHTVNPSGFTEAPGREVRYSAESNEFVFSYGSFSARYGQETEGRQNASGARTITVEHNTGTISYRASADPIPEWVEEIRAESIAPRRRSRRADNAPADPNAPF